MDGDNLRVAELGRGAGFAEELLGISRVDLIAARNFDSHEPVELRTEAQPESAAEAAALLDRLSGALDELPPKLRVLVVLKDVYGLSHEEIAEELGISVSAAKVRLHRGRRRLRDLLYDESRNDGRWAHAV